MIITMSPNCCWIVERIHMSRIGGDAQPSTSPSIERNSPAAAEVERESAEAVAVQVEVGLPQCLVARVRLFQVAKRKRDSAKPQVAKRKRDGAKPQVSTSSTDCWPRMSIPIRSSICIAPAGAAIADALRKNN